jgi:hypothetical protein
MFVDTVFTALLIGTYCNSSDLPALFNVETSVNHCFTEVFLFPARKFGRKTET